MRIKKTMTLVILFCLMAAGFSSGAGVNAEEPMKEEPKKIHIYNAEKDVYEDVATIHKTEEEWKKILDPLAFDVTREHGTERPFTYKGLHRKEHGIYECVACGTDLFSSETKYDSGTGWPSFWKPVADENIGTSVDQTFFVKRVEVHCPRCGAHLGHVFPDGPQPTGQRFCINGAALKFVEMKHKADEQK